MVTGTYYSGVFVSVLGEGGWGGGPLLFLVQGETLCIKELTVTFSEKVT